MSSQNVPIWIWRPADGDDNTPLKHPSQIPAAHVRLADPGNRGPQIARLSLATQLETKDTGVLIADRGATREVPKPMVLPWYEGLLLLAELEARQGQNVPSWLDRELKAVFEKERGKVRQGQLSGALYVERRLVTTAVTGTQFVDSRGIEWAYRREKIQGDNMMGLMEGEDVYEVFKMRDILAYLPPWEALCHERCGFYQDFYQVRWDYPFSDVDFSTTKNGCDGIVGATWEPDEFLPAHLDPLRLAAKRAWIKKRREMEQNPAPKRQRVLAEEAGLHATRATAFSVKRARRRQDESPLERDLLCLTRGHDFSPWSADSGLAGICAGWPKRQQDYPEGYGVADPPGFCLESCNCMDDQRPQHSWETNKAWLEDPGRATAASAVVEAFSRQTQFVRRRGQVSKMCFFETANTARRGGVHTKAALDLATVVERAIRQVLGSLSLKTLSGDLAAVCLSRQGFLCDLCEGMDYGPLCCETATASNGSAPSQRAQLDLDDAHLFVDQGDATSDSTPKQLLASAAASCTAVTASIIQLFKESQLDKGARSALFEHLSKVYDFNEQRMRDCKLTDWLGNLSHFLRMLRSTAVANITIGPAHSVYH